MSINAIKPSASNLREVANRDAQQGPEQESREQRVARLYASPGGPLIGWLLDEARRRGEELSDFARSVGITYGYFHQLRSGIRKTSDISADFARACAAYLGVPPVVVKLVAGQLPMTDFMMPEESAEDRLERAMAQMLDDPVVRRLLPADMSLLSSDAKQALLAMYVEASGRDLLALHQLSEVVRHLKCAAEVHEALAIEAARTQREVAVGIA